MTYSNTSSWNVWPWYDEYGITIISSTLLNLYKVDFPEVYNSNEKWYVKLATCACYTAGATQIHCTSPN